MDSFWKDKANRYERFLLAILLSNKNQSVKIQKIHLNADLRKYHLHLNDELPSGDLILSVEER